MANTVYCVGPMRTTSYCLGEIEDIMTVDSVAVIDRG